MAGYTGPSVCMLAEVSCVARCLAPLLYPSKSRNSFCEGSGVTKPRRTFLRWNTGEVFVLVFVPNPWSSPKWLMTLVPLSAPCLCSLREKMLLITPFYCQSTYAWAYCWKGRSITKAMILAPLLRWKQFRSASLTVHPLTCEGLLVLAACRLVSVPQAPRHGMSFNKAAV